MSKETIAGDAVEAVKASDFSIVTTVYNGAPYLDRYLSSTLAMAHRTGAQIAILDDGSTDGSASIIEEKCRSHSAIKFIHSDRIGRGAALNLCIEAANRPFIAIQDVDDVSLPNRLDRLAEAVNSHPFATLYATGGTVVDERRLQDSRVLDQLNTPMECSRKYLEFGVSEVFKRNFLVHSAVAYRRSDWQRVGGYDSELRSCIDLDMYFKLLQGGVGCFDPQSCVIFSRNPESFFRNTGKKYYRNDLFSVLRRARFSNKIGLLDISLGYARAFYYAVLR